MLPTVEWPTLDSDEHHKFSELHPVGGVTLASSAWTVLMWGQRVECDKWGLIDPEVQ